MGGPVEQSFGRVLQRLRRERSLSQERFAELSDSDRSYVSRLERGVNSPTLSMVFQLAHALAITPVELVALVQAELVGEAHLEAASEVPDHADA